jgi:hypothetical protein
MIFLIDERLEELGIPQPVTRMRSWQLPYMIQREEDKLEDNAALNNYFKNAGGAEFLIRVHFRQNASWQGEVHWLEADKKIFFRSFLELVMLLQEALDEADSPKAEYLFRSWTDKEEIISGEG